VIDWTELVDLASERLGGAVLLANDEFFAEKENLLRTSEPVFDPDRYTDRGKWMDGWETRRRRNPGHDWCLIRLGAPGAVRGLVVDTTHFKGNHPEAYALEGIEVEGVPDPEALARAEGWTDLLPRTPLTGDTPNHFAVEGSPRVTHLRLSIFPDGGVARLRVHGEVLPDWERLAGWGQVDLAALEHGGRVVDCSDMFFGHRQNLILPGRSTHMGDGWETRRRRGPGHDWSVIRLGRAGRVERVEIDTDHFKGNAPESVRLEGCRVEAAILPEDAAWREILPRTPVQPHARHRFEEEVAAAGAFTHLRLSIHPDGGIARLRAFGRPEAIG